MTAHLKDWDNTESKPFLKSISTGGRKEELVGIGSSGYHLKMSLETIWRKLIGVAGSLGGNLSWAQGMKVVLSTEGWC